VGPRVTRRDGDAPRRGDRADGPRPGLRDRGGPAAVRDRGGPDVDQEHSVRFALTSEAGLNDGLAFSFTNLAIALAGAEALSGTLFIYGATEIVGGYAFLAVFVGALIVRKFEWEHEYYRTLDEIAVMVERLLMAVVLVLFGGALAGGLLAPLTPTEVGIGLALLLVVRPVAGMIGLLESGLSWPSRAIVASYGIRGIGSFYYLSHGLEEASFAELELVIAAERLWALLGFVVLASVVIHGITASPVMDAFERWEKRTRPVREARADGIGDGGDDENGDQ